MKLLHMCHVTCVTYHLSHVKCPLTITLCSFSCYESAQRFIYAAVVGLVIDRVLKTFLSSKTKGKSDNLGKDLLDYKFPYFYNKKSRIRETPTLSTVADSRTNTKLKRLGVLSKKKI